jgi:hypothetical protein
VSLAPFVLVLIGAAVASAGVAWLFMWLDG